MDIFKQKNISSNRKGMTLIEIVVSVALLAIIVVQFLNMFLQSTVTTKKSEVIIDATYVAQRVMENIYNDSQAGTVDIPPAGVDEEWDSWGGNYWVSKKISVENNLVSVIVKIYSDNAKLEHEAQMETKFLWK